MPTPTADKDVIGANNKAWYLHKRCTEVQNKVTQARYNKLEFIS